MKPPTAAADNRRRHGAEAGDFRLKPCLHRAEPEVRIHLPVFSGIKKILSFQPFLTRGERSFVPDFVPKRMHKGRVQGPTFRLGGKSRIFFPKPPNSVKHVKGCTPKVLWHSVGMPHDCIVPSEPRNAPRADDYRLLAVQIREIVRATRMASAHRELARFAARYHERATLIAHREYYW